MAKESRTAMFKVIRLLAMWDLPLNPETKTFSFGISSSISLQATF